MMADTRLVQQLRMTQQLVMTPQLRQAIKILQVSRAELESLIDQELTENPVLEEQQADEKVETEPTVDGQSASEEWQPDGAQPEVPEASTIDQIDWKEFAENYSNDLHGSVGGAAVDDDDERRPALENTLVKRTVLADHLMWQLRLSDLPDDEKELAALVIGSLDTDGYLTLTVEEIAFLANVWPHLDEVESVLRRVQDFDPPGVAARDLPECLCIQLRQLGLADESLPTRIVRDHLLMLESRRFDRLAKELGVPLEQVARRHARWIEVLHAT